MYDTRNAYFNFLLNKKFSNIVKTFDGTTCHICLFGEEKFYLQLI